MSARRAWFESDASRRRRLARPVVSVGNLSVGGTGKTPVVAAIAEWLANAGERPAILSRGYARMQPRDGVVVVSDGARMLASIAEAGDEPLMLARQCPRAIVCVSPDRFLAGTLAERRLGATVHILDDGFQQVGLARDLDVLVTTLGEIPGGRVVPRGRLREGAGAAARAHVLVVNGATAGAAASEAWTLGISLSCGAESVLGEPLLVGTAEVAIARELPTANREHRVLAVAGIAHPNRFTEALRAGGWQVAATLPFPDHHPYSSADVARIERARTEAGADTVLTTTKDAVRLETLGTLPFLLFRVPHALRFDPPETLFASVAAAVTVDHRVRSSEPEPAA